MLVGVERMVEVPRRALVDLLDLALTASEQMRTADVAPALPDALAGASMHVRAQVRDLDPILA